MTTKSDETTNVSTPPSRPLWRNRNYIVLWGGQALSDIGGNVSALAFPLLVLAVTRSPAQAGLTAALRTLPGILFALLAGALIDRWNRKRVMIYCDIGRALSLASIPIAMWLGGLTIWQLYLTAFIEGTLVIFFDLAYNASLGQVVAHEQLGEAMAQEEVMEGITALFGPTLSGLLFALNRLLPFLVDSVSYVISVVTLLFVHVPDTRVRSQARRHIVSEIREGMVWLWQQRFLRATVLLNTFSALIIPGGPLAVIVLAQQKHASPFLIGLIFASGGVGSILGSLLASTFAKRLRVGRAMLLVRWVFALLWPLYTLVPAPAFMGVVDFFIGFADPIEDVPYFSYRLALIPDELRGRVISACRLLPNVVRPLGLVLTGFVLQTLGPEMTLFLGSGGLVLIALAITLSKSIRTAGRDG